VTKSLDEIIAEDRAEATRRSGISPVYAELHRLKRNDRTAVFAFLKRAKSELGELPQDIVAPIVRLFDDPSVPALLLETIADDE
jgi:hypothetical protein